MQRDRDALPVWFALLDGSFDGFRRQLAVVHGSRDVQTDEDGRPASLPMDEGLLAVDWGPQYPGGSGVVWFRSRFSGGVM